MLLQEHKSGRFEPCVRSCRVPRCRRFVRSNLVDTVPCQHLFTAPDQWNALFKTKYPLEAAVLPLEDLAMFDFNAAADDESNMPQSNEQFGSLQQPARIPTQNTDLPALVEFLSQRLTELERLAQVNQQHHAPGSSSQRHQSLEALLGMIWQALEASGSSASHQNSPLWNMVNAIAPGIITFDQQQRIPTVPSQGEQCLEALLGMVWQALQAKGSPAAHRHSPLWNMGNALVPGVIASSTNTAAAASAHRSNPPATIHQDQRNTDLLAGLHTEQGLTRGGDQGFLSDDRSLNFDDLDIW